MQHVNHKQTNQPNKQPPTTTAKQTANHQPIKPTALPASLALQNKVWQTVLWNEKKKNRANVVREEEAYKP
jgi:hypothetical protein